MVSAFQRIRIARLVAASVEFPPEDFDALVKSLNDSYLADKADNPYDASLAWSIKRKHLPTISKVVQFVPMTATEKKAIEAVFRPAWDNVRETTPDTEVPLVPGQEFQSKSHYDLMVTYLGPAGRGKSKVQFQGTDRSPAIMRMPSVQIVKNYDVMKMYDPSTVKKPSRAEAGREKVRKLINLLEKLATRYRKEWDKLTTRSFYFKVGGFMVINKGGFDDDKVKSVVDVVERASKMIHAAGFGDMCYGPVNIVGNIRRAKYLAWYFPSNDTMEIRADIKSNLTSVLTFIHEVGHRIWKHKLNSQQRDNFTVYWRNLKRGITVPVVGERWPINFNQEVEYLGGRRVRVFTKGKEPFEKELTAQKMSLLCGASSGGGFVTPYASTDFEENFCEMFSHWAADDIKPQAKADFEKNLYG